MISLYMPDETVKIIDSKRKSFGRGEYIAYAMKSLSGDFEYMIKTIQEKEDEIRKLKSKLKSSDKNPEKEDVESLRFKVCKVLLKKPWKIWDPGNKVFARKAGKFRDNEELETWVKSKQK